jgi:hypothetical protein
LEVTRPRVQTLIGSRSSPQTFFLCVDYPIVDL